MSVGDRLLLEENFTDGNMPPDGDSGAWTLQQTNPDETWYIDATLPLTQPYCGTVHRDDTDDLQDEWLITPSLNFVGYEEINLTFSWYTCFYVTLWKQYIELNISVSIDGGANWTNIWRFNDMDKTFSDWKWYKNEPIDLSDFAGENDVRIAFQYYSNTTTAAEQQEFSIDDIFVIARGEGLLEADAGGPYSWYWNRQLDYWPIQGVRFHGSVANWSGVVPPTTLWDFGDGNTSFSLPLNTQPIHFYNDIGTFNVTLTAIDNSVTPAMIDVDETTITLFLLEPPEIDIELQGVSLGIKGDIINDGQYNATYVNWTINISWGPFQILQIFNKTVGNGSIENIEAGTSAIIRSSLYFFGFGRIKVEITAYPENLPGIERGFKGIKIGPFFIVTSEIVNP